MEQSDYNQRIKKITIDYFHKIDNGLFDENYFNLFAEDVLLEFPKFGSRKGLKSFEEFGKITSENYRNIKHIINSDNVFSVSNRVFVEGILSGETVSGIQFPDNKTSFGKFCTVFEFEEEKIRRISIYSDPDFASEDKLRL